MNNIAYKFVDWSIKPLETYKDDFLYQVTEKLNKDQKLTADEIDRLLDNSIYGSLKLGGWRFLADKHFSSKYFIEYKDGSCEVKHFLPKQKTRVKNKMFYCKEVTEVKL